MKKLLCFYGWMLVLAGCSQKEIMDFESVDRIYWDYPVYNINGTDVEVDSVTASFGMVPSGQWQDTAFFVVKCMGRVADVPRKYAISIVDSLSTMVEGIDFERLDREQVFRAGVYTDTLRIVFYREHLNSSHIAKESKRLVLRIEKSADFDIGNAGKRVMKLSVNNYLAEPVWWSVDKNSPYLKYYHPEKWKVLMYYDQRISNALELGVNTLELANLCAKKATPYLEYNKIYDSETHQRVFWDRLE